MTSLRNEISMMNRRKFISQSTLSAISLLWLPQFIASCKKTTLLDDAKFPGKVIIVGAGVSGMYAAHLLKLQGVEVQILEAGDYYGGRIKSLKDFASFDIELGAEKIRGEHSMFYDLAKSTGYSFIETPQQNFYYFNGNLKSQTEAEENTFFNVMTQLADSFDAYTGADTDAASYADSNGISINVEHIWNAIIGNKRGTSANRIGMFGLRSEWEKWTSGHLEFLLKDKSLNDIIEKAFANIIDDIQLNTVVQSIDFSGGKTLLTDAIGNTYEADKVIVTVPIGVLQQNLISFTPALSESKLLAISRIGFDKGLKIILRFNTKFWSDNTSTIFGSGYVPEFRAISEGRSSDEFLLAAIVMGENADYLSTLGDGLIPTVLNELDFIFDNVSQFYIGHHIEDWGAQPNFRGAISYDKPGTGKARETIASNLGGKVFFAGEATHTASHHGTIQGAMETALRAITEMAIV